MNDLSHACLGQLCEDLKLAGVMDAYPDWPPRPLKVDAASLTSWKAC